MKVTIREVSYLYILLLIFIYYYNYYLYLYKQIISTLKYCEYYHLYCQNLFGII